MAARRPLWTCPRCGKRFVTRNMFHSCVRVSVRDHLKGRPRNVVALYRAVARAVRSCGTGVVNVSTKTRTGWMVRARFAGVEFRRDHLLLSFWLKREISSPRLRSAYYGRSDWVYTLPLRTPEEIDEELLAWLCEAYLVGRQESVPQRDAGLGEPGPRKGRPSMDAPSA